MSIQVVAAVHIGLALKCTGERSWRKTKAINITWVSADVRGKQTWMRPCEETVESTAELLNSGDYSDTSGEFLCVCVKSKYPDILNQNF